jgi:hypothetical protein
MLRDEKNLALMAASSVDNTLNYQELSLASLAASPDLVTPVLSHHWSAVESRLGLLLSRYPFFASMAVYNALGKLEVRYPLDHAVDKDDLFPHSDVLQTLHKGVCTSPTATCVPTCPSKRL